MLWAATLFHIGPNHKTPWRYDLPGAMLTAVGWIIATQGFAVYVRFAPSGNNIQTSVGAILLALTLMYLLSLVLLLGAELNDVISRRAGVVHQPPPVTTRARNTFDRLRSRSRVRLNPANGSSRIDPFRPRPTDEDDGMTDATYDDILLSRDGTVATITLNRPDALNAITPTMLHHLGDILAELAGDADAHVVVLTGAGRAFSAGVDLKALGDRELVDGKVGDILDLPARRVTELLSSMPAITVAKVNGFCFTGALELALACDVIIAAEEAKFGDTHAKFGLRPTWGMSQRLPRLVGMAAARELSLTARTFDGVEAQALGMVARVAPRAELDAATDELVASIAANSIGSLRSYKDLYRQAFELPLEDALAYEASTDYPIPDTATRLADFR